MRKPITLRLLVASLIFLAFGGLYGGISMLTDPTGKSLQMDSVLPKLLLPNYILPGIFLLLVMGLTPLVLAYSLVARPSWAWIQNLIPASQYHWAWLATLAIGIVLMVWLAVQAALIGFRWSIQYITATNGIVILFLTLLPGVRKYSAR
jgi:hypothetical protein